MRPYTKKNIFILLCALVLLSITYTSCSKQEKEIDLTDTKLDKMVLAASKEESDTYIKDLSNLRQLLKNNDFVEEEAILFRANKMDNEGLIEALAFNKNGYLELIAYKSQNDALKAFRDLVDDWACCIPDEDILLLKNFENLKMFKNSNITAWYSSQLVVFSTSESSEIITLLDSFFSNRDLLKLSVGYTGPAEWTINKISGQ